MTDNKKLTILTLLILGNIGYNIIHNMYCRNLGRQCARQFVKDAETDKGKKAYIEYILNMKRRGEI